MFADRTFELSARYQAGAGNRPLLKLIRLADVDNDGLIFRKRRKLGHRDLPDLFSDAGDPDLVIDVHTFPPALGWSG